MFQNEGRRFYHYSSFNSSVGYNEPNQREKKQFFKLNVISMLKGRNVYKYISKSFIASELLSLILIKFRYKFHILNIK